MQYWSPHMNIIGHRYSDVIFLRSDIWSQKSLTKLKLRKRSVILNTAATGFNVLLRRERTWARNSIILVLNLRNFYQNSFGKIQIFGIDKGDDSRNRDTQKFSKKCEEIQWEIQCCFCGMYNFCKGHLSAGERY